MSALAKQAKTKKRTGRKLLMAAAVVLLVAALAAGPVINYIDKYNYPIKYEELVEQYATEFGVDPYYVYAVIRTESSFRPSAVSEAGARGLMQMTEETFDWLKPKLAPEEDLTFDDLYSPPTSIRFGVYFLSLCLERYGGDMATAAAAYHSGWGTVDGLLQEGGNTQDGVTLSVFPRRQMAHYVDKVMKSYTKYLQLYAQDA